MSEPVRRPLAERDAAALIGLLAVLEGELLVDEVDPALAQRIRDRFIGVGLLPPHAEIAHLRRALGELNQRVRHAHGEYTEPPGPEGPARHVVVLDGEKSAAAFRTVAASLWAGGAPVASRREDSRPWVVMVEDDALPLTAVFREHQAAVEHIARRLGGTYEGWEA